jgi:hypothetical protein
MLSFKQINTAAKAGILTLSPYHRTDVWCGNQELERRIHPAERGETKPLPDKSSVPG